MHSFKKDIYGFYSALLYKESSGDPKCINKFKFLGLYQMGEATLIDVGYYSRGALDFTAQNDWIGTWTGKDSIYSADDFLNNPQAQTNAIFAYHKLVWEKYLKSHHGFVGKNIEDIEVTKSGMIAAAHLVGAGALKEYLDGQYVGVPVDGNNVQCITYLKQFAGYELDYSRTIDAELLNGIRTDYSNGPRSILCSYNIEQLEAIQEIAKEHAKVLKFFDIWDSVPEIYSPDLNNAEKLRLLADKYKEEGDEDGQLLANTADTLEYVLNVVGNIPLQHEEL